MYCTYSVMVGENFGHLFFFENFRSKINERKFKKKKKNVDQKFSQPFTYNIDLHYILDGEIFRSTVVLNNKKPNIYLKKYIY